MKKIKKEVKTYKDIYVSVDGKEFDNEINCKAWEKSYEGTMAASFEKLNKVSISTVELGLPWSSDDHEAYLMRPKDLDEIVLINAYIKSITREDKIWIAADSIDADIVINFGYDRDWCEVISVEKHLENVQKYAEAMIKELNAKKEEN